MWKLNIPPKVKMFAWLFIRDRLQTRKRLSHIVINSDKMCPFCNSVDDDQMHLFFNCGVTKLIWDLCSIKPGNFTNANFNSAVDWLIL